MARLHDRPLPPEVLTPAGAVQNITGYVIRFTAKNRLDDLDASAVISGSTIDGRITITDGPGGLAYVKIPGTATASLPTFTGLWWDLQIAEPVAGGSVKTLDSGKLLIEPDVTRATS